MRYIIEDKKYRFNSAFDTETGAYVRTGVLDENGKDTGKDPFMASYPHLIDVGIMGYCIHGKTGLCAKAGISYPGSLDSLISSTSAISAILNNEDAIKYMAANCTGDFMGAFVTNSACRSALDASPNRLIVISNKHWAKFLAMV